MSRRRSGSRDGNDGTAASGRRQPPVSAAPDRLVDPRAVRVALGPAAAHAAVEPIILEPPAVPLAPAPRVAGAGVLGGMAMPSADRRPVLVGADGLVVIDGDPVHIRLDRFGPVHGVVTEGTGATSRTPVILLPPEGPPGSPGLRREIVVDGWRVEVEIESERRASLRERARRGREETAHGGPSEVRAIIPGQVVSVSVVPGEAVVAGQQLLVVEAMKMQNELRAPRDGVISRVAVAAGRTIEVGDLLLVLE